VEREREGNKKEKERGKRRWGEEEGRGGEKGKKRLCSVAGKAKGRERGSEGQVARGRRQCTRKDQRLRWRRSP
jgi:hypothetical protein